jgi:hypothetical protein
VTATPPGAPAEAAPAKRREGRAYRRVASALGTGRPADNDERVWSAAAGSTAATVLAVNAGGPRSSAPVRRCLEQGYTITREEYLRAEGAR